MVFKRLFGAKSDGYKQGNGDKRKSLGHWYILALALATIVFALGPVGVASSQDKRIGFDDGIVGEQLLAYEWASSDETSFVVTLRIGSESNHTGYMAEHLVMGENGAIVRTSDREMFFPSAGFSYIDIWDFPRVKPEAFESLLRDALSHHDLRCDEFVRANFWYTLGATTYGVCADHVIVTPRALALVMDGGHRMRIIDISEVWKLEVQPSWPEGNDDEL